MALVVCAVLGLATFAVAQATVLDKMMLVGFATGGDLSAYSSIVALVLALLAWHLSPRWSWPVLIGLGALCAVPSQIFLLSRDFLADWMRTPYLVIDAAARPLLLVGLVGAAVAVWQAGRRGAGAALLGAPLVMPVLTSLVMSTLVFERAEYLPITGLVLAPATIVAVLVAAATRSSASVSRPEWRVTVGGVVAGVASVVYQLWPQPDRPPEREYAIDEVADAFDGYYTALGQYLLTVGLVASGVVLLAGFVAGPRVLVTGVAAGLVLSAPATLVGPVAINIVGWSTGTAFVLALVALAVGVAVALSRARTVVGVVGLGVVVVWLLVLWVGPRPEEFRAENIGVVLVVLVTAAVPIFASLGTLLAPAEVPAAFAGIAAGIAGAFGGISGYLAFSPADDQAEQPGTYLLVIVPLVVAAGLIVLAHRRWGRTKLEPTTVLEDT